MATASPSFKTFLFAFRGHWFEAMSGAFSVPFAALGAFLDGYAQWIFFALAICAGAFTAYRLWAFEREKVCQFEEKLRPKLKCSFNMNDAGCKRSNTVITQKNANQSVQATCDWYRLKVETDAGSLPQSNCSARLMSVRRGDIILMSGETPLLSFAPGEQADAISKTIYPNVAEHVDILAVVYGQLPQVLIPLYGWKGSSSVNWGDMFSLAGDYLLDIAVVCPTSTTVNARLRFRWTLDPKTSEVLWEPLS